jgi:ethanolamine ammonia-lyase small subunit
MSDPVHRPTETVPHLSPDSNSGRGVQLRALTPARVGLGRTGVSLETSDLLDFQRCHAQARDAVHARLESAALAAALAKLTGGAILRLHSAAADRATYLQRPDLGRTLDEPSRMLLEKNSQAGGSDLALIVADGLSAHGRGTACVAVARGVIAAARGMGT